MTTTTARMGRAVRALAVALALVLGALSLPAARSAAAQDPPTITAAEGTQAPHRVSELPASREQIARRQAAKRLKAKLRATSTLVRVGDPVVFRTKGSKAKRGLRSLKLTLGDGRSVRASKLSVTRTHTYAAPGLYTATLVVVDRSGKRAKDRLTLSVQAREAQDPAVQERGLGGLPPDPDNLVTIEPDQAPGAEVGAPTSADLRQDAMPVQDQGTINSCVSWTVGYAMMGWYHRRKTGATTAFAPMYTYSQTYEGLAADGMPRGSYPTKALKVLQEQGIDTAAHYGAGWATDWRTRPNATQQSNARQYRISGSSSLFVHRPDGVNVGATDTEIEAMKARLAAGTPLAIATRLRSDFDTYRSGWYDARGTLKPGGGLHAMLALGYDQNGLYIQNSWGADWGVNGHLFMTWAAVKRDLYEATFAHGLVNTTASVDTQKPTITSFTDDFATGYSATNSQAPFVFNWAATDNKAVTKYLFFYRANGGNWSQLAIKDLDTRAVYSLSFGVRYQFAVAAYDEAGNLSDWRMTDEFTPGNYSESNASFAGTWTTLSNGAFMNGTSRESSQANAYMEVDVTGRRFALVTTSGPGAGRVFVYVNGVHQFTVDTRTASLTYRNVALWLRFARFGTYRVRIVVEGTSGRPAVNVDSLLVS